MTLRRDHRDGRRLLTHRYFPGGPGLVVHVACFGQMAALPQAASAPPVSTRPAPTPPPALPNVVCVGGSWLCPAELVARRSGTLITALARAAARPGPASSPEHSDRQPAAVRQLGLWRGVKVSRHDALRLAIGPGTEGGFALQGATCSTGGCTADGLLQPSTAISPRQSSAASMGAQRLDGALPEPHHRGRALPLRRRRPRPHARCRG